MILSTSQLWIFRTTSRYMIVLGTQDHSVNKDSSFPTAHICYTDWCSVALRMRAVSRGQSGLMNTRPSEYGLQSLRHGRRPRDYIEHQVFPDGYVLSWAFRPSTSPSSPLSVYSNAIEEYSKRNLTFQSEILGYSDLSFCYTGHWVLVRTTDTVSHTSIALGFQCQSQWPRSSRHTQMGRSTLADSKLVMGHMGRPSAPFWWTLDTDPYILHPPASILVSSEPYLSKSLTD
jgi:hypothetical protein